MREAVYSGVGNTVFNQKPALWLQKDTRGSRWQESKMGHTCVLLCAVCTPAFGLLWYVLGITCYVSHQQTLLPVTLPTHSTKQVVAVRMEVATLFRSRSSYTAGSGEKHSWAAAWCWSLRWGVLTSSTCFARTMTLTAFQAASLFQAAYREKDPGGPVLHCFSLPVTGTAVCTGAVHVNPTP